MFILTRSRKGQAVFDTSTGLRYALADTVTVVSAYTCCTEALLLASAKDSPGFWESLSYAEGVLLHTGKRMRDFAAARRDAQAKPPF